MLNNGHLMNVEQLIELYVQAKRRMKSQSGQLAIVDASQEFHAAAVALADKTVQMYRAGDDT